MVKSKELLFSGGHLNDPMRYLVAAIVLISFMGAGATLADSRGIGVSPAVIDVQGVSSWPHTVELFVKNVSLERESFEITLKNTSLKDISIIPSRFSLGGGETRRILVQLEKPDTSIGQGTLRVTAQRVTPEGFATGTGIEIPVRVRIESAVQGFKIGELLGARVSVFAKALWPSSWIVLFSVILIFFVLRALAFFIYPFFFPVPRKVQKGFMEPGDTIVFDP